MLQHVQTLCMPSFIDLHTHATPGMWRRLLAVETLPIDRWHDRTTGEDLRARSIAIEVKHETLPANRTWLLAAPVATASRSTGMWHAVGAAMAIVLKISTVIIWSWPVKCTTTKDRSRKRAVMAEGYGGRFGRSLLCPGRAEKETRGSWPTTGCLPVNRNKPGPDSWRDKKGVWYRTHTHAHRHTDTHTHTHTHTHGIKAPWTTRSPALARTWPPARINCSATTSNREHNVSAYLACRHAYLACRHAYLTCRQTTQPYMVSLTTKNKR